jgi:hypothetical protein
MADERPDPEEGAVYRDLDRLAAKLTAPKDQTYADIRDEYYRLSPTERQTFRQWVEQIACVKRLSGVPLHAWAKVSISIPMGDDHRELVTSPKMLVEAIQAWDQGQEFLPGVLDL